MAKKVYDADEIMKMAVGLIEPDIQNADYDGNGKVTAADARTSKRIASGLSIDTPVVGNTGIEDMYAVSNAYQNQADAIYRKIQETPDFSYDFNEDSVFKALQEQYMKDGKLASENVQGQAAALSGGYGNSYGVTAAGQAYMGAIDDLYDIIPELQEAAYGRYQDEKTAALQNWEILQDRADKERSYAESERDYQDSRDAYLWELALQKAEFGDYSALKEMGVDTSGQEYDTAFSKALSMAQVGDYSGLKALGVDISTAQNQNELDFALAAAEFGDYSFLNALGIDTSAFETQKYTYSYSGGSGDGGEDDENNSGGSGDDGEDDSNNTPKKTKEELYKEILTAAVSTKTNPNEEDVDRAAQLVDDLIYGNQVSAQKAEQLLEKNYFRR